MCQVCMCNDAVLTASASNNDDDVTGEYTRSRTRKCVVHKRVVNAANVLLCHTILPLGWRAI